MNITISPLAATEVEAVVEDRGVRYPSDDFDSLAEHLACLYDECEILPRPERAVGSILRASEVPAMRMLGRQLGALILELGEAPDSFYLADPRWFDVVVAAEGALAAMES